MPRSISPYEAGRSMDFATIIDVRKEPARRESGLTIKGALRRLPADTGTWWADFKNKPVIVFCVHGHGVSQNACAALAERGIDASYIEGGFEAWRAAKLPVEQIGNDE